jgi:hypothetical protein
MPGRAGDLGTDAALAQESVVQLTVELEECVRHCRECQRECVETLEHCLRQGGEQAASNRIVMLFDCAEICETAASFLIRRSDLHGAVCGVCAEICSRCAEDCEDFLEDERMRRCAEICRECADSCRQTSHSPMAR